MNLLLCLASDFIDEQTIQISDTRRVQHIKKIIKAKTGDTLTMGKLNGKIGSGIVSEIKSESITLTNITLTQEPPQPSAGTLIIALPRPLMLKRILQAITTFGIKDIHFIHSKKVEKSYWNSSDLQDSVIQQQLILGLEQAKDTILPRVYLHKNVNEFIRQELPAITQNKKTLLAEASSQIPCPSNISESFVLALGPEGGFTPEEVETFTQIGFENINLGERIFRVETAVSALLGKLSPF